MADVCVISTFKMRFCFFCIVYDLYIFKNQKGLK